MWWWKWNRKWDDVYGSKQWDMIGDLDSDWSIDCVGSDGIIALRMGSCSGEMVTTSIGRNGQRLHFARRWRGSVRRGWWCGGKSFRVAIPRVCYGWRSRDMNHGQR